MTAISELVMVIWFLFLVFNLNAQTGSHSLDITALPAFINTDMEESKPVASNGGDSLYFVRSFESYNRASQSKIWMSHLTDEGNWAEPVNEFRYLNHAPHNQIIGISQDGSKLYSLSYISIGGREHGYVRVSNKEPGGWGKPESIGMDPIAVGNSYHEFFMHGSGMWLFVSMRGLDSVGQEDLYLCMKNEDGSWTQPVNLGSQVNTTGFEISPFLSADQNFLYFASNGLGGEGDSDIWVSERQDNTMLSWGKPTNLGKPFNSSKFDAFYYQSASGRIFFTSNRNSVNADIYTTNILDDSKEDQSGSRSPAVVTETQQQIEQPVAPMVLYFDLDSSTLISSELSKLEGFCNTLESMNFEKIIITGYTDATGDDDYNRRLSEMRAIEVKKHFLSCDSSRSIETFGAGIFTQSDAPGEMRRVEIYFSE